MRRETRALVYGLVLALLPTGCQQQAAKDEGRAGAGEESKPRIALVMKSLANEFFQTMEAGAKKHQAAHAGQYELIANGIKDEQDVGKQIDLVEQMIARRVDALVIAPADSKALIPVCKKAQDAGIAVINIDNRFDRAVLADKDASFPFVGPDNRKGARMAAEVLANKLQPGDSVAIVEGAPNAFNAVQRRLGFEDAVKAKGLRIAASQTASWETDRANEVVAAMLTTHPEIKGVLCANDSMALGAVSAVKTAGRSLPVVGFDNISAIRQLIRDGKVLATVDQHGDQLAVFGIEYALSTLGKKGPLPDKETAVDLITAETLSR